MKNSKSQKAKVVGFMQLDENKCRLIGSVPTVNLIDKTKYKKTKKSKKIIKESNIALLKKGFFHSPFSILKKTNI